MKKTALKAKYALYIIILFSLIPKLTLASSQPLSAGDMAALGQDYQYGENGKEQDYDKARKWYLKSAELGNAYSQFRLGEMYFNGIGIEKDVNKAAIWMKKSALQGDSNAQYTIGRMYFSGIGVEENEEAAAAWMEKSATQGLSEAQYFIGLIYQNGYGVEENRKQAIKWYKLAADQEHIDAMEALYEMSFFALEGQELALNTKDSTLLKKRIDTIKKQNEPEIFLIPEGYQGIIRVVFNVTNGQKAAYENNKRLYIVSESGLLLTQMKDNGLVDDAPQFFYVDKKGARTAIELSWSANQLNDLNSDKVGFLAGTSNGSYTVARLSCQFRIMTKVVGTQKILQAEYTLPDPFDDYLEKNSVTCPNGSIIGGSPGWNQ